MRVAFLTALTMVAFAANSLLNRAALAGDLIDPGSFASLRVLAGAVMLVVLLAFRARSVPNVPRPDVPAALALTAYLAGFSFAYVALDAGLGALVLFGGVQVTMFAGGLLGGERPPIARWLGMAVSLAGLALLVRPGQAAGAPLSAFALMAVAAVGWGVYSLIGRQTRDPLASTTWNFVYAAPAVLAIAILAGGTKVSGPGVALAALSGAVTSGLGYALWYALLPGLGATRAAVAQLSVPVIALVAGVVLLGEAITPLASLASVLILGGIALGLAPARARVTGK
ncbi:DMT family transporter [Maritimibacter sp. DP1N21-5]|uniref:DMT family transporter n=1 Tax=Maritimibacter sp. DP1N21-5 TaxID=2836867 RepID=UPI001C4762B8|nr:DMT family transporter [Maritimibacter sp. DP1N21-5]MBV7408131.1 DMT family transporter [Maritimibacter sp. DP1N21-5]